MTLSNCDDGVWYLQRLRNLTLNKEYCKNPEIHHRHPCRICHSSLFGQSERNSEM